MHCFENKKYISEKQKHGMQCFENNNAYLNIQCTKLKHECTIFKIKIVCLFLETNLANLEKGLVVSIMCFVIFGKMTFYFGT